MPRSSTGIYTLPESAFIAGTVIRSSPVNNDFSDIATALTQSLATTGVSAMSGVLRLFSGSVLAPALVFSASLGTGWYRIADNEVGYAVAGVNKATYFADGTFNFSAISFGNAAVAGNFLDWYEEGTFTPVLRFGGASVGITYSIQEGAFTRIGNMVFFDIKIFLTSNGSSSGDASISGLPYTPAMDAVAPLLCQQIAGLDEFTTNLAGRIFGSSTIMSLVFYNIAADDEENMNDGQITSNAEINISGAYRV